MTAAAHIERTLGVAILRGDYPPGLRLPSVRQLAAQFDVNQATVQRAIARLEVNGLVAPKQGSGILVQDPAEHADISLVGLWLEAFSDDPPRAAAMLRDFLDVRKAVATRLLVTHRDALLNNMSALTEAATHMGEAEGDAEAFIEADLALARVLLRLTGNVAALCVLNTARRLLREVPAVAAAMYADPSENIAATAEVLRLLHTVDDPAVLTAAIEAQLTARDEATVRRYRATLTCASQGQPQPYPTAS